MAGAPPDDSDETTPGGSNPIPRPPVVRPPTVRPPGRADPAPPTPTTASGQPRPPLPPRAPALPPRVTPLATPPRTTPTSSSMPNSRKVPRPQTQSQPASRPVPRPPSGVSAPTTRGTGAELGVGQLFAGRYRIQKQIGKGGMGAVYLATQEPLARMVAIKVLHGTADEVTVGRFQREARLIAQLQHPHIVGLIDFGEEHGRLFLVMEFIDGEPLTAVMAREAPFEARRACDVALQIAEALAVAHDIQVVHRDVKPDNVMILPTAGGQDFVKMLDFGVAKIKRDGENNNTVETRAGLIVGSLRYISPEQVESGEITPRTDMYSFGCVVYEMLAGHRVFEYASPADCAIAHITEPPKPPDVNGQVLSGPLVDLVMRCLNKKPEGRPANAREAIQALMACRDQPLKKGVVSSREAPTLHTTAAPDPQSASTVHAVPAPVTGRETRPGMRASPDAQIRPARPTGVQSFAIVGADTGSNTSTELQGVRLQPRTAEAATPKSRWWLWLLVGLASIGAGVGIMLLVLGRGAESKPAIPVEGKADVVAHAQDATERSGVTSDAGGDGQAATGEVADAESAADAATEVSSDAAAPDGGAAMDRQRGALVITDPPGASISRDKKLVCTTPCIVPWGEQDTPPLVRVSLKGYIDIDLQFVKADRGTDQHLTLRKQP